MKLILALVLAAGSAAADESFMTAPCMESLSMMAESRFDNRDSTREQVAAKFLMLGAGTAHFPEQTEMVAYIWMIAQSSVFCEIDPTLTIMEILRMKLNG